MLNKLTFTIGTKFLTEVPVKGTIFVKNIFDTLIVKHIFIIGLEVDYSYNSVSSSDEKAVYLVYQDTHFETVKRIKLTECTITLGWYEDQADETAIYYQTAVLSEINKMLDNNILITTE